MGFFALLQKNVLDTRLWDSRKLRPSHRVRIETNTTASRQLRNLWMIYPAAQAANPAKRRWQTRDGFDIEEGGPAELDVARLLADEALAQPGKDPTIANARAAADLDVDLSEIFRADGRGGTADVVGCFRR